MSLSMSSICRSALCSDCKFPFTPRRIWPSADYHLSCCKPLSHVYVYHSLSQPPECFLTRSKAEIVLRSSSWSVSCSGVVVWRFCMSSSCEPLLWIISSGSRQAFRQIKFEDKNLKKVRCVTYPVFEGLARRKMHKIWSESNKSWASYTFHNFVTFVRWPESWRQLTSGWRQTWRDNYVGHWVDWRTGWTVRQPGHSWGFLVQTV